MQPRSYYNTTSLTGEALKQAIQNAKSLDQSIELLFKNYNKAYSPSQVLEIMQRAGRKYPLTSVRRSMTNLTKEGVLVKTGDMIKGMYSAPENTWKIKRQVELKQGSLI